MCGIAGFVVKRGFPDAETTVRGMMSRLEHRGPDGDGVMMKELGEYLFVLGHQRLSIIDIDGGAQPMQSERAAVTYNGEIFNFLEIRESLERESSFGTHSDTEVILKLYEQKGESSFQDLSGMFAFGLLDFEDESLSLVRDRSGIKPLYYSEREDGSLIFASELTSLLEFPALRREKQLSAQGIQSFFFSDYVHPEDTILEGIRKLAPGQLLKWKKGISEKRFFWDWRELAEAKTVVFEDPAQELWTRLGKSVKDQLIADVPVGVFLSGGLDSSVIAALAVEKNREKIQTFSIGFEEADFDESPYARKVASQLRTEHTQRTINETILLDRLDDALDALDEPMGDPSILPTFLLSELAAKSVKVALGGDGGDELWAGYPTYWASTLAKTYRRIPGLLKRQVVEPLISKLPVKTTYQSLEWKLKRFALRWDDQPFRRHLRWMSNLDLKDLERLTGLKTLPTSFLAADSLDRSREAVTQLQLLDYRTYLPGSVLTKVDRASMAHGLEVRPPFLDPSFVSWAFGLPASLKLRGNSGKVLLKKAAEPYLPSDIIHRKKKGFAIPLARWTQGALKSRLETILNDSPVWDLPISHDLCRNWNELHQNGSENHSRPLWNLLVLDHWMKRVLR